MKRFLLVVLLFVAGASTIYGFFLFNREKETALEHFLFANLCLWTYVLIIACDGVRRYYLTYISRNNGGEGG